MNNSIKFSIIMPCYNSESYVRTALESITAQTYPNWELIAVNDGSEDSTGDILASYAHDDDRIKVYKKSNGGYVSAVNFGLDKITGDYLLLLGSDDRLSLNLLGSLAEQITGELPDCIAFLTEKIENGVSLGLDPFTDFDSLVYEKNISLKEMREKHPAHSEIFCVKDTSKCFKKETLGDLRFFGKYGIDADGIFSLLFCHKSSSFLCVPVIGYYWTLRDDSVSGKKTTEAVMIDRINNWSRFFDEISELDESEITYDDRGYLVHFVTVIMKLCYDTETPGSYKRNREFILASAAKAKELLIHFSILDQYADLRWFVNHPGLFAFRCGVARVAKKLLRRSDNS